MAKLSRAYGWKKNGIVKLKVVAEKLLQRSLSHTKKDHHDLDYEDSNNYSVPEDVKEGHFAVMAMDDGEPKRFVVPLSYLTHPAFRKLLEQAAEEFGFDHDGALTVPCRSSELKRILVGHWEEKEQRDVDAGMGWETCETMIQSC
ncbi:Auxin-induced protein [Macleaya cordata]|uniref:Auxin-induced protein n=1 Tax=Macleaya cordata TaxID=56857 RepID=A0A200R5L6_MACCD|nr:Auxin-induced protein [Macleaya cordata]